MRLLGAKKYFAVSTDKAANPVNMMGASKKIMELFLMRRSEEIPVSTARFANVAFRTAASCTGLTSGCSNGSPCRPPGMSGATLLPLQESGQLCLLSCLLGENRDIFFPKLSDKLHQVTFAEIAVSYLAALGYEAVACDTEEEARQSVGPQFPKKMALLLL
jgi:hypothetical protein